MQQTKIGGAMLAVLLGLGGSEAVLASECKGLEQGLCEARAECRWIAPYERKDGKQVAGYCRIKMVQSATDAPPPATETPQPPATDAPPPAPPEPTPSAPVSLDKPAQ